MALEMIHSDMPRLGEASLPNLEPCRIGQWPLMEFALGDVAHVDIQQVVRLYVQNFGLLGPHGALPLHITDYIRARLHQHNDTAMLEFLNIFQHRFYLLFYRAWANSKPAVAWREKDMNPFSRCMGHLSGDGLLSGSTRSVLDAFHRLAGVAHLTRSSKTREGLCRWLSLHLRIPISHQQEDAVWMRIPKSQRLRLSGAAIQQTLGHGAVLGTRVIRSDGPIRLLIHPTSFGDLKTVLPEGVLHRNLWTALWAYLGQEFDVTVQVSMPRTAVPVCQVGRIALNRHAWLGQSKRSVLLGTRLALPKTSVYLTYFNSETSS